MQGEDEQCVLHYAFNVESYSMHYAGKKKKRGGVGLTLSIKLDFLLNNRIKPPQLNLCLSNSGGNA